MIHSESREFDATYMPLLKVSASLCMTPCWKKDINALDICRLCLWINNHFALCFSTVSSVHFWGVAFYTVSLTVCFNIANSGADFVLQFNYKLYSFNIIYYFGNEAFIRLSKSSGQWCTKMRGSGTQGLLLIKVVPVDWKTPGLHWQYRAAKASIIRSIFCASPGSLKLHKNCLPGRDGNDISNYNGYLMDLCLREFMEVCMIFICIE